MADLTVVDTFEAFLRVWDEVRQAPVDVQAERWMDDYLRDYPELAEKVITGFEQDGLDWRRVARERSLPLISTHLDQMRLARSRLLAVGPDTFEQARVAIGLDFDVTLVLYVGLGWCGWGTSYGGDRACLLGLEGIAEEGWTGPQALAGLVAHEIGHLAQAEWRDRADVPDGDGPTWQLYAEGFAQVCEHTAMGADTWHMQASDPGWLGWCRRHLGWLAQRYLGAMDARRPVNDFFGNWLDIKGRSMTGYYLGHEVVARWREDEELRDVALLPAEDVDGRVRGTLRELAGSCS